MSTATTMGKASSKGPSSMQAPKDMSRWGGPGAAKVGVVRYMPYARSVCTVILATRVWPELPLLVATNRDEHLDRPSQPPSRWLAGSVAPRDERAGGTWIGCSDAGVIAAVTNRFGSERDPERRSRAVGPGGRPSDRHGGRRSLQPVPPGDR